MFGLFIRLNQVCVLCYNFYPPASEARREVANLTERKNPHAPIYGVKEFVCLSVCLLQTFTPIFSELAEQNGIKKNLDIFGKMNVLKSFYLSEKWPAGPGSRAKIATRCFDLSFNQNQKPFEKKFATLAARAVL